MTTYFPTRTYGESVVLIKSGPHQLRSFLLLAITSIAIFGLHLSAEQPTLQVVKVTKLPTIDGLGNDAVWASAPTQILSIQKSMGKDEGKAITQLRLKAVYTETDLAILAIWTDDTENRTYKTWVWDAEKSRYKKGHDLEDIFSIAFPIQGQFSGNMLSPVEVEWDVWHWNAGRTDVSGYAIDRRHIHTFKQPKGRAKQITTLSKKKIWFANPTDRGHPPMLPQPKPKIFQGQRVPSYLTKQPTQSQADVIAKGTWQNSIWQLEMQRNLDTGFDDDLAFDPNQSYQTAIAIFDHAEGGKHGSSQVVEITFRK